MDITKSLRIKAGMIAMGEKIAFGSDSALMEEAANEIDRLRQMLIEASDLVEEIGGRDNSCDPPPDDYVLEWRQAINKDI